MAFLFLFFYSFLKKFEKVEKTGIISTKFSLRCTPSVKLGVYICVLKSIPNNRLKSEVQLNKYETDPYSLQIFPINMSVCLIISVFCKSFELICEPEITPVSYQVENLQKSKQKQLHNQCSVHKSYKPRK